MIENTRPKLLGCVSLYADPLHAGHIELLRHAKLLCDRLIVIVNNDIQCINKKGYSLYDEAHRLEIIQSIRYVDDAILSIDTDESVAKTLAKIRPDIFINSGDRNPTNANTKELEILKNVCAMPVYILTEKSYSSSEIVNKLLQKLKCLEPSSMWPHSSWDWPL